MSAKNNEVMIACTSSNEFKMKVRMQAAKKELTVSKYLKGLIEKDLEIEEK